MRQLPCQVKYIPILLIKFALLSQARVVWTCKEGGQIFEWWIVGYIIQKQCRHNLDIEIKIKQQPCSLTYSLCFQREGVNPDREHLDNMEKLPERRHLNLSHKDLLCIQLGKCSPAPLICNTEIMILRYRISNIIVYIETQQLDHYRNRSTFIIGF